MCDSVWLRASATGRKGVGVLSGKSPGCVLKYSTLRWWVLEFFLLFPYYLYMAWWSGFDGSSSGYTGRLNVYGSDQHYVVEDIWKRLEEISLHAPHMKIANMFFI